ncbi:hypothetical protein Cni_G16558 [Canna indica]|uniref:Uncharacterized protein n=1 Tax=Canna indica TaxID=4628 RepID=A0AAQ3KFA8_9LILI|nr:hypothetical protein Cni_G16558 [Canna indica]
METIRSWDMEEHRQRWKEVYEGLGEIIIAQEYNGLCTSNTQNQKHDESSDDEPDNILRPPFLVDGEPDNRWEAAQIPKVKVSKIKSTKQGSGQAPYMPKIPEIEECPIKLLPSKLWQDTFLAEFSEFRQVNNSVCILCSTAVK